MKKYTLVLLVSLTFSSLAANAETVLRCQRNDLGFDYHATIKISEEKNSSVFLSADTDPVGKQSFYHISSNGITMKLDNPISGTSYDDTDFSSVDVSQHSRDEAYSVTLYGPALKKHNPRTFGSLTFFDCHLDR